MLAASTPSRRKANTSRGGRTWEYLVLTGGEYTSKYSTAPGRSADLVENVWTRRRAVLQLVWRHPLRHWWGAAACGSGHRLGLATRDPVATLGDRVCGMWRL